MTILFGTIFRQDLITCLPHLWLNHVIVAKYNWHIHFNCYGTLICNNQYQLNLTISVNYFLPYIFTHLCLIFGFNEMTKGILIMQKTFRQKQRKDQYLCYLLCSSDYPHVFRHIYAVVRYGLPRVLGISNRTLYFV